MAGDDIRTSAKRSIDCTDLDGLTIERLRTLPLFAALDREGIAALLDGSTVCTHRRDEVLFRQGDPAERFYVVLAGRVALHLRDKSGRESIIEVVKPGDSFGEEAVFDRGRFAFGARAIEQIRTVRVPAEAFLKTLADDFRFATMVMASMSAHLHCLVKQVGELKLKTTEQRIASYLLSLATESAGPAVIELPYDKRILASELSMTPESFSRALGRLRDVGVTSSGGTCRVDDVCRLRLFCHEMDFPE